MPDVKRTGDMTHARLRRWMVRMAVAVGAKRTPRETVADVMERLAGDALEREYDASVTETKASKRKKGK